MKSCTVLLTLSLCLVGGCKKQSQEAPKPADKPADTGKPAATPAAPAGGNEITLSCGSVGKDFDTCKSGAEAWAKKTSNTVKVVTSPTSSTEKLALAQQLLAAGATDVDIFSVDVVWPGILGTFFLDLKQYSGGAESQHFEPIIANNTVDGKLVAMPWYTDAGLLYYRKDLLEKYKKEVPTTWEQMTATAKEIQEAEHKAGKKELWGFVFQGKAYEGLTCNALEWVASFGGGTIVGNDGKVTIDNPKAAAALDLAATWIGSITPPGVLNYEEEESRGVFQSGNAVFMRNWPYAYQLSQAADSPIKDKVGMTTLPKGSGEGARGAATMGGWNLSVSKFTKHPKEAADLVMYLTGPEEQKRRAVSGGYQPTIKSLYDDKEVLAANPSFSMLLGTFSNAVPRPSTATKGQYNQASSAFWTAAQAVLNKQKNGKAAVHELAEKLDQLSRGGNW
ncbi:MAG TPA: ABC transporter substrate-binding protein [Kofleriaceae bacterium]|nr:ABC transporter substrate-binding protein [Kofleriaceae bacterium]